MRRKKCEMVDFLSDHPECFEEAVGLALKNEQDYSWRAAWMIADTIKENDARVKPHVLKIIKVLPDRKDGHQRELLKILLKMELTKDFESALFDTSITLWEQVRKKPSVRCFAFKAMIKVAEKYPELKKEVLLLAQPHYINPLSPGIRKSILKDIRSIER
jgi:hypothetical protein